MMNNLWISLLIGPKCPNPDAMVLISTCFQQQYGRFRSLSLQHVSSIKSDLKSPNDNDCHECVYDKEFQMIFNYCKRHQIPKRVACYFRAKKKKKD